MYSVEQKRAAIETYIRFDHSSADAHGGNRLSVQGDAQDMAEGIREDRTGPGEEATRSCTRRRSLLERGVAPCKANAATAAELGRFMLFLGQEAQERASAAAA